MKLKDIRGDRDGLTGIVIAVIAIAIVAIVIIAAIAFAVGAMDDNQEQPDVDLNGDGKVDPIIGYIVVTGTAYHDNTAWTAGTYFQTMESCTMTLQDTPVTMDFMAKMADLFPHTDSYQMKFTVTQQNTGTTWSPSAVGYDLTIGGGGYTHINKQPNGCLAIRYHGPYHLLVQLLADEGGVMDEISMDKVF